jgi:hypothetical protein
LFRSVSFGAHPRLRIIGDDAFSACTELIAISIPATVVEIQDGAFCMCGSLSEVSFESPSVLNRIGDSAFAHCR